MKPLLHNRVNRVTFSFNDSALEKRRVFQIRKLQLYVSLVEMIHSPKLTRFVLKIIFCCANFASKFHYPKHSLPV